MRRNAYSVSELQARAAVLRRRVVEMVSRVKIGYIQQGLGAADLFAALYFAELRLSESDPAWPGRDRMILSTAHNTAVFYAALVERGLLPKSALTEYTVDGAPYEVNASERVGPLVEATCGSLGQGLSVAVGMALSQRRRGSDARVYVVLGDGELQEGQVWEAAMSAGGFGLGNLCLIVDRNYMQVEGHTDKVVSMDPVGAKFEAFGWRSQEIDGNDMVQILAALEGARAAPERPTVIVARTLSGKGVPFLEGRMRHLALVTPEEADRALAILESVGA